MKLGVVFFLLFFHLTFFAQNQHESYNPITNFAPSDSLINSLAYKLNNPNYQTSLKNHKHIKELKEIYLKRSDYIKELHNDKMLMQHDPITNLLQEITNLLLQSQPNLTQDNIIVFTVRDNEINAFSLGKGVVLINIALLERLNSWEEIAFILGHEAGHDIMVHALKSSEKNILIKNDKNLIKEVKTAAKKEYGSYTAVKDIYYNIISLTAMHSRENELQSDSIGFYLLNELGLTQRGGQGALTVLDSSDYFLYDTKIDVAKTFSNDNYTFNEDWLESGSAAPSWSATKKLYYIPDSLKTHPNINERKKRISLLNELKNDTINANIEKLRLLEVKFSDLKKMITLESILTQIETGNYSLALYNAINVKQIYEEEPFVDYLIAHSLLEIIVALKNQRFNAHVPFPNKKFPENFNEILHFLHNTNSSKLTVVYNNFIEVHLKNESLIEYNHFLNAYSKFYIERYADEFLLNVPYTNYYHQKVIKNIKSQLIKK
jgi:hypothetical protein